jgi:hypothetical protein
MADFAGGPIPMAGVPVEKAGGNGTGFVNVGVNQSLGSNLSKQSGINLAGGQNVLKSQLTPLISAKLSNQLSKTVEKTAGSVGSLNKALPSSPFLGGGGQMGGGGFGIGNVLGGGGFGGGGGLGGGIGGFLSGLGGGGGLLGGMGGGGGGGNKVWPGGGGSGPSNYGGFMHNLGPNGSDVVFSIVPANNGPQTQGLQSAISNPTTATTLPTNNFTNQVPSTASPAFKGISDTKFGVMTGSSSSFSGSYL